MSGKRQAPSAAMRRDLERRRALEAQAPTSPQPAAPRQGTWAWAEQPERQQAAAEALGISIEAFASATADQRRATALRRRLAQLRPRLDQARAGGRPARVDAVTAELTAAGDELEAIRERQRAFRQLARAHGYDLWEGDGEGDDG